MAIPLGSVKRGDRVMFDAGDFNAMQDAAKAHKRQQRQFKPVQIPAVSAGTILVRNDSGYDVVRFGVLAIDGVVIGPADNEIEFTARPCVSGVIPTESTRNFVIVQEPIASGRIGTAVVHGTTIARLDLSGNLTDKFFAVPSASLGTSAMLPSTGGQAEILYRPSGPGEALALVRISNTPSVDTSAVYLGIVRPPSANGSVAVSYTVDVYGTDFASLSEDPTEEGVSAIQDPTETWFFHAEVVALQRVGSQWRISKLLTHPIAYEFEPGQIGIRIKRTDATLAAPDRNTNYIVDVTECSPVLDNGAIEAAYIGFSYGDYAGFGYINKTSVPVVLASGWNLATVFESGDELFPTLQAIVTGTVTSISSSQDTVSTLDTDVSFVDGALFEVATGTLSYAPDGFVYLEPGGSKIVTLGVNATIWLSTRGAFSSGPGVSTEADLYPGLLALPSIPGGVDSTQSCLLAARAYLRGSTIGITTDAVTKLNPTIFAFRTFPAGGGAIGGTFDKSVTTYALSPSVTVASA